MTRLVTFAGDLIDTSLPLGLAEIHEGQIDLSITVERRAGPLVPPELELVVSDGMLAGRRWTFGAEGGGSWAFEFGPGCVGALSGDHRHLALIARLDAPQEWISQVVVNWALVMRLVAQDRWAFHASTVSADDETAIAVIGSSGAGKSTLAGSICAGGGSLLGDDVWAGQLYSGEVTAQSTSRQLRLRNSARSLGAEIDHERTFETSDERLAVEIAAGPLELPVRAIVLLERGAEFTLRPIDPRLAIPHILAESKVSTWRSDEHRAVEFDHACAIAERVPAFIATLAPVSPDDSAVGLLRQGARLVEELTSAVG